MHSKISAIYSLSVPEDEIVMYCSVSLCTAFDKKS